MKITNTQSGPRGLNAVNGAILVDAGATIDAEVYAREQQGLEASGWFTVEGDYTPNPGQAAAPQYDAGELAKLKAEGAAKDGEISDLAAKLKTADAEIEELKKKLPETDIDKMTVPELRAHLAFHDIAFDSKKDKKEVLVTLAKAAA